MLIYMSNPTKTATVRNYHTGETLEGRPSRELARESAAEQSGTGAVGARLDDRGVWQYVSESECDDDCVTVWVE